MAEQVFRGPDRAVLPELPRRRAAKRPYANRYGSRTQATMRASSRRLGVRVRLWKAWCCNVIVGQCLNTIKDLTMFNAVFAGGLESGVRKPSRAGGGGGWDMRTSESFERSI